jgi:hypothetical protein
VFQKSIALAVSLALFMTSAQAGIGGDKAAFRGGTIAIKEGAEEKFSLVGDKFTFDPGGKNTHSIPYEKIKSIEYGQKAGRRIGAAAGLMIAAGPIGALALLSKKRRHMVSLTWESDQGKTEGAVFEFGKDSIRSALKAFEARSGRPVDYESEDARKNLGK